MVAVIAMTKGHRKSKKVTVGHRRSFNSMAEIIGRKWQFAAAKIKMQVKLLLWLRQACMMLRLRSAEPYDEVM